MGSLTAAPFRALTPAAPLSVAPVPAVVVPDSVVAASGGLMQPTLPSRRMNAPVPLDRSMYLGQIRSDAYRIAAVVTGTSLDASLDAAVAACPGWSLRDLVVHVGRVHRWARTAVTERVQPDVVPGELTADEAAATSAAGLAAWLSDGADALVSTLEATPDDAPTWHPFGGDQVAAVWQRRQAHETMVHRWDAELAAGEVTPMPPHVASDGIDELFAVMLPRFLARGVLDELPTGSLHVHCTDVDGEWLVWADDGTLAMRREHAKGDAALRGPAAALLLHLWGRATQAGNTDADDSDTGVVTGQVDVVGDPAVADAWSALTR